MKQFIYVVLFMSFLSPFAVLNAKVKSPIDAMLDGVCGGIAISFYAPIYQAETNPKSAKALAKFGKIVISEKVDKKLYPEARKVIKIASGKSSEEEKLLAGQNFYKFMKDDMKDFSKDCRATFAPIMKRCEKFLGNKENFKACNNSNRTQKDQLAMMSLMRKHSKIMAQMMPAR